MRTPSCSARRTSRTSSRRSGRGAAAAPDVDADVVVVAACGEEQRPGVLSEHDVEAEDPMVERFGAREVRDAQVDVAQARPRVDARPCPAGPRGLREQAVEVERLRAHEDLTAAPPPTLAG